jgi:hypothetical protein
VLTTFRHFSYPEPDELTPPHSHLFLQDKIQIVLLSSKWCLSFRFPLSSLPYVNVPHQFHPFDFLTLITFDREQTTDRRTLRYAVFFSYPCHNLLTKATCLPHHPILRLSEPIFSLMRKPNFTHISNSKQNYNSVNFSALILREE